MRIVFDVLRDGLSAINAAASRLSDAQRELSSGRRLNALSDDPRAAQQSVIEHATLAAIDAYSRSAGTATSRLTAADNVLSHYIGTLTNAITTATSARGSAVDPQARAAAADALRGFRDTMLADINTNSNGTYLFSGSRVDVAPYAQTGGWTYQGDGTGVQVDVDRGRRVAVTFDGAALAQGTDVTDVFSELDALATAVEAGDQDAIANGVEARERAFSRATRMQTAIGLDETRVEDAIAQLSSQKLSTLTRRAALEDADMGDTIVRLQQADQAYRAALGAVSSAERVSLLDYLR